MKKGKRLLMLLVAVLTMVVISGVVAFADDYIDYRNITPNYVPDETATAPSISYSKEVAKWTYGDESTGEWVLNYDKSLYTPTTTLEYAELSGDQTPQSEGLTWSTTMPKKAGKYAVRAFFEVKGSNAAFDASDFKNNVTIVYDGYPHPLSYNYEDLYSAVADDGYKKTELGEDYYLRYKDCTLKAVWHSTYIYPDTYYYFDDAYDVTLNYYMYKDTYAYNTFEIEPRPITGVAWTDTEFTYDGQGHSPTAHAQGLIAGDTCTLTLTDDSSKIGAGTYTAKVLECDNRNYCLPEGTDFTTEFVINPLEVTLIWPEEDSWTYNGSDHATVEDMGIDSCDPVISSIANYLTYTVNGYPLDEANAINAGEYKVVATCSIKSITLKEAEHTFTINKDVAEFNWDKTTVIYTGAYQEPEATMTTVQGTVVADVDVEGESRYGDAGEFTAKATIPEEYANNYTLEGSKTAETEFTILPKPVTIEWGETTFTFLDKKQMPEASLGAAEPGKAEAMDGKLHSRHASTVKVVTEVSVGNDAPEDLIWFADGGVEAYSNYTATAIELTGNGSQNYAIVTNYNRGDYTALDPAYRDPTRAMRNSASTGFAINKQKIKVKWDKKHFVYNGSAQAPVPTIYTEFPGADLSDCEVSVTLTDLSRNRIITEAVNHNEKGYRATASLRGTSRNYSLTNVEGTVQDFDIAKKPLTITANNKGISYGQDPADVKDGVSYDGLVNGSVNKDIQDDGVTPAYGVIEGDIAYEYSYEKNGKPGAYTITPVPVGEVKSQNYEITFKTGALTVADNRTVLVAAAKAKGKKALKFTWNPVNGAASYEVYLNKCNTKKKTYTVKKISAVKGSPLTFTKKKLKAKTAYKFYVVAKDANGKVIAQSVMGHAVTGNVKGKYTNAKSMGISASSVKVSKNGTAQLTTTYKKAKKGKKLLSKGHAALTRYISENPAVATVDANGVITGVSKGWCRVYAQGVNGIWKEVEVNVQ